jgi:hypothetical protein
MRSPNLEPPATASIGPPRSKLLKAWITTLQAAVKTVRIKIELKRLPESFAAFYSSHLSGSAHERLKITVLLYARKETAYAQSREII